MNAGASGRNGAGDIVEAYMTQKRLADMGFVTNTQDLDPVTEACFVYIAAEISVLSHRKDKQTLSKGRR